MDFFLIRLKGTDRYVSNTDSSYAIVPDQEYDGRRGQSDMQDAHWFIGQDHAKVLRTRAAVRSLMTRGARRTGKDKATFDRYQVIEIKANLGPQLPGLQQVAIKVWEGTEFYLLRPKKLRAAPRSR